MKRKLLTAALAAAALTAQADDDYGLWLGAEVQKSITKQFSAEAGIDYRLEDKFSETTRIGANVGLNYKPLKWLSIGVGYTFLHDQNLSETEAKTNDEGSVTGYNVDHAYWRNKHRATFDVQGSVTAGRFTFSLRERYQYTHYVATTTERDRYRGLIPDGQSFAGDVYTCNGQQFSRLTTEDKEKDAKDRHYLRSRIGVEYNIRHCAWTPHASYEFSNSLNSGDHFHLDKQRLTVGAEWKITKHHRLDFAYVFSNGADDDNNGDTHALSIGYKFKF